MGMVPWINDPADIAAWKEGRTGYPIVDAGMRQLVTIGWMPNRVRMIVASFLIKDLLLDWRLHWRTLTSAARLRATHHRKVPSAIPRPECTSTVCVWCGGR